MLAVVFKVFYKLKQLDPPKLFFYTSNFSDVLTWMSTLVEN
jgi:hypothetical protein